MFRKPNLNELNMKIRGQSSSSDLRVMVAVPTPVAQIAIRFIGQLLFKYSQLSLDSFLSLDN